MDIPWRLLASPRLTVSGFVALAFCAIAAANDLERITLWVILPLSVLSFNLIASLVVHPRLRSDPPLLLFHLALLAFLFLLAFARLIYFDGGTRLTTGNVFQGNFESDHRGPLHSRRPESLRFAHEGLIERRTGRGFPATHALVSWWDGAGRPRMAEIGNDRPLVLDGFRIFATSQRGYAPLLSYRSNADSGEHTGAVQLSDAYRERGIRDFTAGTELRLPDGEVIWVQVVPQEIAQATGLEEDLGVADLKHVLIVREGDRRHELKPGDTIDLAHGQVAYLRLSTWMGYRVTYDPTPPWLAAAVLLGVASLCWFYARVTLARSESRSLSGSATET